MKLVPTDLNIRISQPDNIYNRDSDSITFILSPDNKLYNDKWPATHTSLIDRYELGQGSDVLEDHIELRNKGYLFGRMGTVHVLEIKDKVGACAFYPMNGETIMDDGEAVTPDDIKRSISELVKKYPDFLYENMHIVCMGSPTVKYTLEDVRSGNLNQTKEDDPDCQRIGVPVDGQEMSIKQILANLHMVRGDQFEKIKHGFCPLSQKLNQQTSDKCPSLNKTINYISRNLKCGQEDYQNILKQGKQGYRQQLKSVFGNSNAMDSEFRTQKDMDKAWDFYRKAESVMGFEQWMRLREGR